RTMIDVAQIRQELVDDFGSAAEWLAPALVEETSLFVAQSPFFERQAEYSDLVELRTLLETEELPTSGAAHFDQRFINYLNRNFGTIDKIHWRQFEGLTAEWFERQGYRVEIGPGRNDDNIDLRLWNAEASDGSPPTVVVQCKRQMTTVGKLVVKAL